MKNYEEDENEIIDAEIVENEDEDSSKEVGFVGSGCVSVKGNELGKRKEELISEHKSKNGSVSESMRTGNIGAEEAMNLIILELLKETESLKGNELLFEFEGNLRDATTVQVKRVEALEKVAKTIHRKFQMTNSEVINLDSPYIRLLITWLVEKIRDTFIELKFEQEMVDIFFGKFATMTENWKTDVKREMVIMQQNVQENEDNDNNKGS